MTKPTYTVLASGQPRPYADSIYHVRVTFPDDNLDHDEAAVRARLLELNVGFTEHTYPPKTGKATAEDYFRTRLDWLRKISPGVWEFHTTSAYTD